MDDKPPVTNPEVPEIPPETPPAVPETPPAPTEGQVDVPPQPDLGVKETLGKVLNIEFKSDEDALKKVVELNKFVGDQAVAVNRKKAEQLEEIKKDPAMKSVLDEIAVIKFSQTNPNAVATLSSDAMEDLKARASRKNVSLADAYKGSEFQELVDNKVKEKTSKENVTGAIPGTTNKIATNVSDDQKKDAVQAANEGNFGPLLRMRLPDVFKDE